jgi:hypothetical protein
VPGFENRHGEAHRNGRNEEQQRQNRRVPEGIELLRHDQKQRAERALVQGGKQHAQDHHRHRDAVDPLDRLVQAEALEDHGQEFEEQHRGV